jgi:hypothetical protein
VCLLLYIVTFLYQAYYTVLWCCQHYCQSNPSETMLLSGRRSRMAVSETRERGEGNKSTDIPWCNS